MPQKRESTDLEPEEELVGTPVEPETHPIYSFLDADIEVLLTPPADPTKYDSDTESGEDDEPKTFPPIKYFVHKRNLVALSSVFEVLIDAQEGPTASARKRPRRSCAEPKPLRIEITEQSKIFEDLLPYFYRSKGNIALPDLEKRSPSHLIGLLYLADKYKVFPVKDLLEERFCMEYADGRGRLHSENAFKLYVYASRSSNERLKTISRQLIRTVQSWALQEFDEDAMQSMPGKDVDLIWRHHFSEQSAALRFLQVVLRYSTHDSSSKDNPAPHARHLNPRGTFELCKPEYTLRIVRVLRQANVDTTAERSAVRERIRLSFEKNVKCPRCLYSAKCLVKTLSEYE